MIKEFFEIGKEAPEKIHIDICDKDMPDRGDLYDSIIRAVTSAFYRLFNTKELYKITVDIRLEKRFTKTKKEEETKDEKDKVSDGIKAEEKSGTIESSVVNSGNNGSGSGASKYHNGYSDKKKD